MTDDERPLPELGTILVAAEAAGWPTVQLYTLILEGEASWRRVLSGFPRPTPGELSLMLEALGMPWLSDEMVATKPAQERLRQWVLAGRFEPTPDFLLRHLRYLGDNEVRSVVLKALHERIPAPCVAYLLDKFLFVGVGWSAGGYMIRTAMPPGQLLSMIPLSGASHDPESLLDFALHECAHGWLMPEPANPIPAEAMFNEVGAGLLWAAKRPDEMRSLLRAQDREEEAADALARAWGGRLTCTAERDRNYTLATARQLHETYGGAAAGDTE